MKTPRIAKRNSNQCEKKKKKSPTMEEEDREGWSKIEEGGIRGIPEVFDDLCVALRTAEALHSGCSTGRRGGKPSGFPYARHNFVPRSF